LNWGVSMPPYELNGEHDIPVDSAGNVITTESYLANVQSAANNGQVYNPTLGWTPIRAVGSGMKYPYRPFYGGFGPRISAAWSPTWDSGWLGSLFGHKSTVLRGGYARIYDRTLPINYISGTVLGDGFLQSVSCTNASMTGQCAHSGVQTEATAFRIGVDGNVVPSASGLSIPQTLSTPVQPGVNASYATLAEGLDQNFRPGESDQFDVSIQRQLKHEMILEVGYVGTWSKNLYQGIDLGNVPWMMKQGGQIFASAYDAIETAYLSKSTAAPQAFFETALAGSPYCAKFSTCTAAVAANEAGNLANQGVTNLWSDLDTHWTAFGPALTSTNQCFYCYTNTSDGYANYQAMLVSLQKRTSNGLTMNANFTYAHALGTVSLAQTYTLATLTDAWNPRVDYGPQYYDRKFTFNLLGTYQLPLGPSHRFGSSNGVLKRLLGGWAVSPIFSAGSGLPLPFYNDDYTESDQAYGQAFDGNADSAIPVGINTGKLSNKAHFGVTSDGTHGVNADGYTGANIFGSSAAQVFGEFRPALLGVDGRSMGTGELRGQSRWNLDLGLTKDTRITERVATQFYVQAFNALNHMEWGDPFNSLQDPADFGALEGQYGVLNSNYTRVIQLGLRVSF